MPAVSNDHHDRKRRHATIASPRVCGLAGQLSRWRFSAYRRFAIDEHGVAGIAYYAARQVNVGEPLLVCVRAPDEETLERTRNTSCAIHRDVLDRWSRLQRAMLAPYVRAW